MYTWVQKFTLGYLISNKQIITFGSSTHIFEDIGPDFGQNQVQNYMFHHALTQTLELRIGVQTFILPDAYMQCI